MTRIPRLVVVLAAAMLAGRPAATDAAPATKPAAPAPRASATPAPAPSAGTGARRLDDVRIEGELEVPRVTFITVRQPHRFHDYARATSVRPARQMAAGTALPGWIAPVPKVESDTRKENRK